MMKTVCGTAGGFLRFNPIFVFLSPFSRVAGTISGADSSHKYVTNRASGIKPSP